MAITNATDVGFLCACIKVDPSTVVSVTLDADLRYRLVHTGVNENLGADTELIVYRCQEADMGVPADPTAALTGLLGEGFLSQVAGEPVSVDLPPRTKSVKFISAGATNPVVLILPLGSGGRM